eukprot:946888_1
MPLTPHINGIIHSNCSLNFFAMCCGIAFLFSIVPYTPASCVPNTITQTELSSSLCVSSFLNSSIKSLNAHESMPLAFDRYILFFLLIQFIQCSVHSRHYHSRYTWFQSLHHCFLSRSLFICGACRSLFLYSRHITHDPNLYSCIFETVCHIQFIYSLCLLSSFPYTFAPAIAMSLRFFLIHLVSVLWYHVHAVQSTFVYR